MDSIAILCNFANPGYGSIVSSCCVGTYLAMVMDAFARRTEQRRVLWLWLWIKIGGKKKTVGGVAMELWTHFIHTQLCPATPAACPSLT